MAEIQCPKCGTLIALEPSDLDSIVSQVRDEEFQNELEAREKLMAEQQRQALELVRAEAEAKQVEALADLKSALAKAEAEQAQAMTELKAQASQAAAEANALLLRERSERDARIAELEEKLRSQGEVARNAQELAIAKAVNAVEKERDNLDSALKVAQAEGQRQEAVFKEQLAEQLKAKDDVIAYQQGEIERIKDMKARLSTKLVGESLEQHCQIEFDRIRAVAFPNAYFEKDNQVVEGTKGDFIFREEDEDGNEIISIMFEMKNEEETSATKKRNEDHFDKLNKDRLKKGCEYAVLVSLLEPDNELYNQGIVDVSHRYPKMYVIRPQFFIPLISLLRNGALSSLQYKRELALVRQQDLDITNFEQDLERFKDGFFKNFGDASLRFDEAVKAIDKAISDLEKAKSKLLVSEKHLNAANNKLEGLTVKKLTRKNPTMKARFEALEAPQALDEEEE